SRRRDGYRWREEHVHYRQPLRRGPGELFQPIPAGEVVDRRQRLCRLEPSRHPRVQRLLPGLQLSGDEGSELGPRQTAGGEGLLRLQQFRHFDALDLEPAALQLRDRRLHALHNARTAILEKPVAHAGAKIAWRLRHELGGRDVGGLLYEGVDRGESDRRVCNRAGQDPGTVESRAEGNDACRVPTADAGLDADRACQARRDTHGTGCVGTESKHGRALMKADTGATAGAARYPVRFPIPRVSRRAPMGVGADAAEGELDGVRLAGYDGKVMTDRRNDLALHLPLHRKLARRARECGVPRDAVEILD